MNLDTIILSFNQCFCDIPDPRESHKILYPLQEILLLVLCGTLCGSDTFCSIALWGRTKLPFLRTFYPFEHGIPSHDTLNNVINSVDFHLFSELFSSWVVSLSATNATLVHLDGKTSRRSRNSEENDKPLHVVSAWASDKRLVLGQESCLEKSNEITAIPELIDKLNLKGSLVTIDAMGCQTKIAEKIIDKGANYVLALKDNQRSLAREVELYFEKEHDLTHYFETLDADHGRIEKRKYFISNNIDWMIGTKNAHSEKKFKNLSSIGMVQSEIIHKNTGKISQSIRFYISSARLTEEELEKAVRSHWSIENNLHWILDVVFYDDLMRLRTKNGAKNMNIIKQMAVNLLSKSQKKISMKLKRQLCSWDEEFLTKTLLTQS